MLPVASSCLVNTPAANSMAAVVSAAAALAFAFAFLVVIPAGNLLFALAAAFAFAFLVVIPAGNLLSARNTTVAPVTA